MHEGIEWMTSEDMMIKIITGGQTGVDQAAMDAAIELGLLTGGWCPPGRECDNGIIPSKYKLRETTARCSPDAPHLPRSMRTKMNVFDANALLVLRPDSVASDPGTDYTILCAQKLGKPILILDPYRTGNISNIRVWLKEMGFKVLCVAGPSERTCSGVGSVVYSLMKAVLEP